MDIWKPIPVSIFWWFVIYQVIYQVYDNRPALGFRSLLQFSILACSQRPKPKFKGYFKVNPNSTPFAKIRPCWRQHRCQIGQVQGHASLYFEHLILFTLKYWALPSFTQPLLTRVLASSISCRGSWFTGSFGFPLLWDQFD